MFRLQISAFLLLALVMSIYSAPRGHYKKKKVEVSAPSQRSHSANDNKKVAEDAARREEEVALLEELLDLMAEGIMMTSSNGIILRVTGPFVRRIHRSPVNYPHKVQ